MFENRSLDGQNNVRRNLRGVSFLESRSPLPSERDKGRPNRGRRIDYHLAAWRQGKSAGIKLKYDDRC